MLVEIAKDKVEIWTHTPREDIESTFILFKKWNEHEPNTFYLTKTEKVRETYVYTFKPNEVAEFVPNEEKMVKESEKNVVRQV